MPIILNDKTLASLIKTQRKRAGITQLELAELAGVGKTLVFNLENGVVNAHFEKILKILRVLNIKLLAKTP